MEENIAIIETGGKQYLVKTGMYFKTEIVAKDSKVGDKIEFDKVLLKTEKEKVEIGTPYVKNSKVMGTIKEIGRDKKINVIRFYPKSNYKRRYGHRQPFITVTIDSIN